jgi:hypothetical protein
MWTYNVITPPRDCKHKEQGLETDAPRHDLPPGKTAGRLGHRLKTLTYPSFLVVDEIGYLPISPAGAMLLFQLINRRYEHASTVLMSNKGFEDWGSVLGDEVMAAALIDRLEHHRHIVNIRGNSYRMRNHNELSKALRTFAEEPNSSSRRRRGRRTEEATTN